VDSSRRVGSRTSIAEEEEGSGDDRVYSCKEHSDEEIKGRGQA
jgi:hypothetical protein